MNKFSLADFTKVDIDGLLVNDSIKSIKVFALGPDGTNISQAAKEWTKKVNIEEKSEIILCSTPEEEIIKAMEIKEKGELPIFALCAVYYDLCNLYFKYYTNYFFLSCLYMKLDTMQLASKKQNLDDIHLHAKVAGHNSPKMLLANTSYEFVDANSNAEAAKMCSEDKVEVCITTESAKNIYGLHSNFIFGSPVMLFTFGTTEHGINVLNNLVN